MDTGIPCLRRSRALGLAAVIALFSALLPAAAGVALTPKTLASDPTATLSTTAQAAGRVVAWGYDGGGETDVPLGLSGVTAIAAFSQSLALKSDGTVVAWGADNWGQADVPVGLSSVVAVSAGSGHSLALKSDGTVVAWGEDGDGETDIPAGLSNVIAISAGAEDSLALKSDGTVVAWGNNASGQTDVPAGLSGVTSIAAGYYHSLALKSDGTVVAWGADNYGQIDVPAGLSDVMAISAGGGHSLALKSDGTVVAWGKDDYGQAEVPAGLSGVVAISAGGDHSLALKSDGTVVGWGFDQYDQTNPPAGLAGVAAIAAGNDHSLALVPTAYQTISFAALPDVTYGSGPIGLTATASSGLPVSFTTTTPDVCAVSDSTVTLTSTGSCTVTASQAGDDTWAPAPDVSQSFTVAAPAIGAWTQLEPNGAGPTTANIGGSAWDPSHSRFFVFGGTIDTVNYNNDLWEWTSAGGWQLLTSNGAAGSPPGRNSAAMVWDAQNSRLLLFGGSSVPDAPPFNDLWQWTDAGGWQQLTADGATGSPQPRNNTAAVWDDIEQRLLVSDGWPGIADLWQWTDAGGWQQLSGATDGPPNRLANKMAWDHASDRLLFFGGTSPDGAFHNDLWQYTSAGGWRQLSADAPAGPQPRGSSVVVWDDVSNRLLVYAGGSDSGPLGDLWQWTDAGGWSELTSADDPGVPDARIGPQGAWDPQGDRMLVYGGWASIDYTDLWSYNDQQSVQPQSQSITFAPLPDVTYGSGPISLAATASSGLPVSYAASGFCSVDGNVLSITGPGTCTVTASQGGDASWAPAPEVSQNFQIRLVRPDKLGWVAAWGSDAYGQTNVPVGLSDVVQVASGANQSLALKSDGTVIAWGWDADGVSDVPPGLADVVAIAGGAYFSLALKSDGTVVEWGLNGQNQPSVPAGLSGVVAIAAGYDHSLALKSDGTVVAWGVDTAGDTDVPAGLSDVKAISVGGTYNLALEGDGTVVAWGDDGFGAVDVPVGLSGVSAITAGGNTAYALEGDGTVVAWGYDAQGQRDIPAGLTDVVAIAGGGAFALALKADGTVVGWGYDGNGEFKSSSWPHQRYRTRSSRSGKSQSGARRRESTDRSSPIHGQLAGGRSLVRHRDRCASWLWHSVLRYWPDLSRRFRLLRQGPCGWSWLHICGLPGARTHLLVSGRAHWCRRPVRDWRRGPDRSTRRGSALPLDQRRLFRRQRRLLDGDGHTLALE